jgi:hypothetical protein
MLIVTTLVVLAGIGIMFYVTVQEVNDRVDEVNRSVDSNFDRVRTDVQRQLQAFQNNGGGALPTPTITPVPTEVPTVDPGITPEATETPTVEGESTPDAGATSTPTPEEPEIINP